MKIEEFNKIIDVVKSEQEDIFKKVKVIYDSGEYDLNRYKEIGAYSKGWYGNRGMLEKIEVKSSSINDCDITYLMESLKDFYDEYNEINEIGKSIEADDECGDGYIEFIGYTYSYFKLSEDKLNSEIGRLTREKIKEVLKPEDVKDSVIPDCKMVQLFRDGAIDWEVLQKITYRNCEL